MFVMYKLYFQVSPIPNSSCEAYFKAEIGLNPKGPYVSLEKEKQTFCVVLTYSITQAREIGSFKSRSHNNG